MWKRERRIGGEGEAGEQADVGGGARRREWGVGGGVDSTETRERSENGSPHFAKLIIK